MTLTRKLPRGARWAVPGGAVAAVGLVIAGSALAGAQAAPRLPARTTAQLLAAVDAPSALPSAMQAVVQETVNLGLPALPGSSTSDPLSGLALLSGTHTFRIWYDGPTRVRIAIPVTLGEADLRRDGRDLWLWDSRTNQATHYVLPAGSGNLPAHSTLTQSTLTQDTPAQNAPTPPQLARQILTAVGQTTRVGLQPDVTVAGQAAYQLSLAPKDGRSLIGRVRIAIDAANSLPLRVEIFARGASSPALEVAYTSISFTRPDPSNFPFTPPPGAKVKTVPFAGFSPVGPLSGLPGAGYQIVGQAGRGQIIIARPDATTCPAPHRIPAGAVKRIIATLPKGVPRAARAALLKSLAAPPGCSSAPGVPAVGWAGTTPSGSGFIAAAAPRVVGKDWLSVLVLPGAGAPASGAAVMPGGSVVYSTPSTSGSEVYSSTFSVSGSSQTSTATDFAGVAVSGGPGVDVPGLGSALLSAARPVRGPWGSGRLLRTSLISVLITNGGTCLIGAVRPSVLYADAAQLG